MCDSSLVPRPLFFFLCGGGEKRVWWISNTFLCSRIYNFWGSLISGDEQQRPVNEATIGIRCASAWQGYILGYARNISYCCFVNRPLLFITTNQRSPKVVDSAAQKMYWRSTRPFFSPPPHKKKKSGLGTRLV